MREVVHKRIAKTIPMVLFHAAHQVAFGWRLGLCDGARQGDGTWHIGVRWIREPKEGMAQYVDGQLVRSFPIYSLMPWSNRLRLLWFYMRSRRLVPADTPTIREAR